LINRRAGEMPDDYLSDPWFVTIYTVCMVRCLCQPAAYCTVNLLLSRCRSCRRFFQASYPRFL
jgi:hypothetical protein